MHIRALSTILAAILLGVSVAGHAFDEKKEMAKAPSVMYAPLKLINNRIFTTVIMHDGSKRKFLIDNGWSMTTVDPKLIADKDFTPEREITSHSIDKRGRKEIVGSIPSLKIGDLELCSPSVRRSEIVDKLSRSFKHNVDGIFACEPMHDKLTTFEFKRKRVRFEEHSDTALARINSKKGVIAIPFGKHPFSEGARHLFSVDIEINGNTVPGVIDLGFSGGILTSLSVSKLGIAEARHERGSKFAVAVAGYSGEAFRSEAKSVHLGGHKDSNVPFICFGAKGAPDFALIGVDYLRQFEITFDYKNRYLYLAPQ